MTEMSELDVIIDLHINSERQGPGSPEETLKALDFINLSKGENLKVADIGCGSGGQTITLAQHINGRITAVDLLPMFLDELNEKAEAAGVHKKIETLEHSMDNLPFDKEAFDIIWSEGAIYNIGFEAGIKKWKDYLKPGGYLSVTEMTWITDKRPKEIKDYWKSEYVEVDTASNKINILEENGYTLAGYFYLAEDSWIENYYKPMESRFSSLLECHNHSELSKKIVKEHEEEIAMYLKFKEYYSYGFYIARKN